MASPDSIHHLLTVAAKLLDQAASEIRDGQLPPIRENIDRIGRALVQIFEVQKTVHAIRPELKPKYLEKVSSHSEANKLLTRFMFEASELEYAGNVTGAIQKFEEFLTFESSPHHREIAEGEIQRLRGACES